MADRVSDQIAHIPAYLIPKTRGAGTNKSLDTTAPTKLSQSMGKIGCDNLISIWTDTAGSISLYLYNRKVNPTTGVPIGWMLGGANVGQYQKTFEANCLDIASGPEGADFYLTATVEMTTVFVDAPPAST